MAYKNLYLVAGDGKKYHAGMIADAIDRRFPGIRETPEYDRLQDLYMDYTQACDVREQRDWMGHYMWEALKAERDARVLQSRGKDHWNTAGGKLRDAAIQFLVAYDLYIC